MQLPRIDSYYDYRTENYGVHALRVYLPGVGVFFFSYKTCVAFSTAKTGLVCRENEWGSTTGKHLNAIEPNKKNRVSSEEFQRRFTETFPALENIEVD